MRGVIILTFTRSVLKNSGIKTVTVKRFYATIPIIHDSLPEPVLLLPVLGIPTTGFTVFITNTPGLHY